MVMVLVRESVCEESERECVCEESERERERVEQIPPTKSPPLISSQEPPRNLLKRPTFSLAMFARST